MSPSLSRSARRLLVAVASVALVAGVFTVPSAAAAASMVSPHTVSTTHPYSDPIYYPLHDFSARMDCVVSNPGCTSGHTDQAMTLQTPKPGTQGGIGNYVHVNVYPAGAGIVHIGAHATSCGPNAPALGNWVWIDHGGGLVTRYAHLVNMQVTEGEYVDVNTVLGQTGDSGEKTCGYWYLNFQLKGGGFQYGTPLPLRTLTGCDEATSAPITLPTVANAAWKTFNDVPKGDYLPASGTGCLPTGTPATLSKPTIGALTQSGTGALTVHWSKPVHRPNKIQIEVRLYHPANNTWETVVAKNLTVGTTIPTSYLVKGLISRSKYDARVSFHNGVGWSLPSNWSATQTVT
jgi:hypothetical protein